MSKWDDWDCEVTRMRYLYFDRGLETVLKTSNVTNYPAVCASATASFSVLSETISVIHIILKDKHHRDELSRIIAILQSHEKEKLSLTAALHLERIREQNQVMNTTEGDARVTKLLNEGVTTIRQHVSKCVEGINEALEELRYAIVDED
jgi:DNA repair REX1-B